MVKQVLKALAAAVAALFLFGVGYVAPHPYRAPRFQRGWPIEADVGFLSSCALRGEDDAVCRCFVASIEDAVPAPEWLKLDGPGRYDLVVKYGRACGAKTLN